MTDDDSQMIHFFGTFAFKSGPGWNDRHVAERGDELLITDELRKLNPDVFDLAADAEGQRRLFGRLLFGRGPWPSGARVDDPAVESWYLPADQSTIPKPVNGNAVVTYRTAR